MTTATLSTSLGVELHKRWNSSDHRSEGTSGDALDDVLTVLGDVLIGPYRVYVESEDGEAIDLGGAWAREMVKAMESAAIDAWTECVVPAAVATIMEHLRRAPAWLQAHPDSKQLRADLALVTA